MPFYDIAEDATAGVAAEAAHTYKQIITESKEELVAMVNRDRAEDESGGQDRHGVCGSGSGRGPGQAVQGRQCSHQGPGTAKHAMHKVIRRVQGKKSKRSRSDRWVTIYLGGRKMKLFADTGSKFTILPPSLYHPKMGKVKAANCILMAWGSNSAW